MATLAEMSTGVRQLLRDFPQYFEIEQGPLNVLTVRLPHPFVSSSSLQVYISTVDDTLVPPTVTTALTSSWQLDERNGLLKLTDPSYLGQRVLVSGYHYTWFSDSDLMRAVTDVTNEFMYDRPEMKVTNFTDVEAEVAQLGAVVRALWSLTIELALDIDVSTPEGMFIPAHQRYSQVVQQMQYWENEYTTRAQSLNLGLGALEIFRLRRVSYTTGRYVPVYKEREIDDPRWPKRLYPPIPGGMMEGDSTIDSTGDVVADTVNGVITQADYTRLRYGSQDLGLNGGWFSIGTSGDST